MNNRDAICIGWVAGSLFMLLVSLAIARPEFWTSMVLGAIWVITTIIACGVLTSALTRPRRANPDLSKVREMSSRQ